MRVTNSVAENVGIKNPKACERISMGAKNLYRLAKNAVMKAGQHAYKHRRQKT